MQTTKCKKCGAENPKVAFYCGSCGVLLYSVEREVVAKGTRREKQELEDKYIKYPTLGTGFRVLGRAIQHWWSEHTIAVTIGTCILIVVGAFSLYVWVIDAPTNQTDTFNTTSKTAPSILQSKTKEVINKGQFTTKRDSAAYLVGINFGSFLKNYNFGDLKWKRVSKGMTDYFNSKGSPKVAGFDDQFEISPRLINDVFDSYLAERNKGIKSSRAKVDSVSYLAGINYGSFLKGYYFEDLDHRIIKKGIDDYLAAKGNNPKDSLFLAQFTINANEISTFLSNYTEERKAQIASRNRQRENAFLTENKTKPNVVELTSGLQYTIIEKGNTNKPRKNTDTVYVQYKGTLLDGSVFDEVTDKDKNSHFRLSKVIKGWQEGLKLIGEGGRIVLYVPSRLAYGEKGNKDLEPNATLIFDIQLLKVVHGN